MVNKHLFCFGLGYVSTNLANNLPQWKISGTHTGRREFKANEYDLHFDKSILDDVTHILISIPPTEDGDLIYLNFYQHLKNLKNLSWIGYLSSTSVYGDHQGLWVNENSKTDPDGVLGKNRLIAEKQWLDSGLPINIFRLAGIYGPGRSVFETIKQGKANRIYKENHYFSRIHVDDIVTMLKASMNNPKPGEIYNIADDSPSPQHEVVEYACKLMGTNPPELIKFEEAKISEGMKQYYNSSKRVDNSKIKATYNLQLKFPSYKEGLLKISIN
jgi:nucleoside-diphosphate-sugar epimerase